jgi:hypothetical protein
MALVQKPKVAPRAVVDSRIMRVGTRLSQEYIESVRAKNDAVWLDKKSWFLCFYFGQGDDRLWVPAKSKGGQDPVRRVINFSHSDGRQAAQVLLLAYLVGFVSLVIVGAIAVGYRW